MRGDVSDTEYPAQGGKLFKLPALVSLFIHWAQDVCGGGRRLMPSPVFCGVQGSWETPPGHPPPAGALQCPQGGEHSALQPSSHGTVRRQPWAERSGNSASPDLLGAVGSAWMPTTCQAQPNPRRRAHCVQVPISGNKPQWAPHNRCLIKRLPPPPSQAHPLTGTQLSFNHRFITAKLH